MVKRTESTTGWRWLDQFANRHPKLFMSWLIPAVAIAFFVKWEGVTGADITWWQWTLWAILAGPFIPLSMISAISRARSSTKSNGSSDQTPA